MKDIIHRQTFEVVVQAAAGGRVIARGKIPTVAQERNGQMLWG